MPPHRIRAVLGLHAISEFKNKDSINKISTAYEIELRNIVVHPKYACKRPYDDIGNRKIFSVISFLFFVHFLLNIDFSNQMQSI